jgi:metal-sulfur cluster biosynthetic enzyme|tara:strand:+ start:4428 stop:4727 length:300 start_codon:yes stop_codon:yes gene_type:complete
MKAKIIENLQQVYDPEISINIYDLGLIYDIEINEEDKVVNITHTLTSPFCGFADIMIEDIKKAGRIDGINNVNVITTFDPPFSFDKVSEEVRMVMGWYT